jgi:hypothetical protein
MAENTCGDLYNQIESNPAPKWDGGYFWVLGAEYPNPNLEKPEQLEFILEEKPCL